MRINPKLLYDSGSNSNGSWIKYSDGTMVCYGKKTGTTTYSDFWSFAKRSPEGTSALQVSLPQSFIDTEYKMILTPIYTRTNLFCAADEEHNKTINSFRVVCFKALNDPSNNYGFLYVAIGKWK